MESLLNQLVYFGYFQSIFLLFIYWLSPKNRKNINGYVAVFVLVLWIGLTGRILYISGVFGDNYRWVTFSEFATLLFGATIYLFTRSSLFGRRFSYRDLWHYAPAFFFNLAVTILIILPSDELILARRASGAQYMIIVILVGVGLSFNIAYWVMSLRLFIKFRKTLRHEASYQVKTQFFLYFLIAVGVCMASWLFLYALGTVGGQYLDRSAWQTVWLSVAMIILFIAYYGMKEPDLYKMAPRTQTKKYAQSKLSKADLDALQLRLEKLMEEKKPYLNRKLLKAELAAMLGVSNPEIARLLNEKIGMNFFEYINYYRIKEFVALAKTEKAQQLTLFGLAQEAGFNSKTTFNKSFKELMGTTPKAYFSQASD